MTDMDGVPASSISGQSLTQTTSTFLKIGSWKTTEVKTMEQKKQKLYIIHSEYVQNGMTFNSKNKFTIDSDKAVKIYEETVESMKMNCSDMVNDKDYKIHKRNAKTAKHTFCYYKHDPGVSNFFVELSTENLE